MNKLKRGNKMFDNGLTPSDISAIVGNNNDGFGGNNGILWFIIILFALFGGFGGNGWGNNNGGVTDGYVLASDFANIERKIDTVNSGICSLGYDQLAQLNGINQNVSTTGFGITNAINGVSQQMASCCCETQRAIDGINYNLATNSCAIQNSMQNSTRDIIDNQNANTKSILDFLVNDKISTLESENQALRLTASQTAQNEYLISRLQPTPVPSFSASTLYGYYGNCGCGGCNGTM